MYINKKSGDLDNNKNRNEGFLFQISKYLRKGVMPSASL